MHHLVYGGDGCEKGDRYDPPLMRRYDVPSSSRPIDSLGSEQGHIVDWADLTLMGRNQQRDIMGSRVRGRTATNDRRSLGMFATLNIAQRRLAEALRVRYVRHRPKGTVCSGEKPVRGICPAFSVVVPITELPE